MIEIRAEMDASVLEVCVATGAAVRTGDELVILESMKMEIPVESPADGVVAAVHVGAGDAVTRHAVLVVVDGSPR